MTPERLATLRQIAAGGERPSGAEPAAAASSFTFFGRRFVAGATPGVRTEPMQGGPRRRLRPSVKSASGLADYTIVTDSRARGRPRSAAAGGFPGHLRARDGRCRRRHVRRTRPARAARRRDLQGQADPVQPGRFHLPERDAAAAAERELRISTTSAPTPTSTISTTPATTSTSPASRPTG